MPLGHSGEILVSYSTEFFIEKEVIPRQHPFKTVKTLISKLVMNLWNSTRYFI